MSGIGRHEILLALAWGDGRHARGLIEDSLHQENGTAEQMYGQQADQVQALLAQAWQEGRESLAQDMTKPLTQYGTRPTSPNPYLPPSGSSAVVQ